MLINANVKINQDLKILVAPIELKYWGYRYIYPGTVV